ncbi:hypothetical protein EA462_14120 [Natrarchaeobius halalkaliphilus]|uniref:Uncharacterized protein n=1 Tax=Natrarchaeobius halalkaliphilus TaxID=1679091 RepID=A0A3N6LLI8_9EURY|nr:peptidase dimerization domain-containing protein [Natrarchaeobius halalkaliphilus]RQG87990.1 hypothetical protein EA462_14120 [Natrarchaeobius halalkaliphilus]
MSESEASPAKRRGREWIESNRSSITELSDEVWECAEPALREYDSARAHVRFLEEHGFDVEHGIAGMPTAFVATYGTDGPVMGFYAEYDATPGNSQEQATIEKSPIAEGGSGFEDIHNGLGTAGTAAAVATRYAIEAEDLDGQVKILGTPAEKLCIGKVYLAREGYLDDLDATVAWHPHSHNTVTRYSGPGPYRTAIVDFEGVGVYGGSPWDGVSALDAATMTLNMVEQMKEHVPRDAYPSVNELITNGGQCLTNLPKTTQIWFAYRSRSQAHEVLDEIRDTIERAAAAAADVTGAEYEFREVAATRPWLPNTVMTDVAYENMEQVGPPSFTDEDRELGRELLEEVGIDPPERPFDETLSPPEAEVCGNFNPDLATYVDEFDWNEVGEFNWADDVTEFSWHSPTAWIHTTYFLEGAYESRLPTWTTAALATTNVAHETILTATKIMTGTAVDLLTEPERLERAQAEYRERTDDEYVPVLLDENVEPPTGAEDSFPPFYPESWTNPVYAARSDK